MGFVYTQSDDSHADHGDEVQPSGFEPLSKGGAAVELAIVGTMANMLFSMFSICRTAAGRSSGMTIAREDSHSRKLSLKDTAWPERRSE